MKNICERLLLKISTSVTNSDAVVQRCVVKKSVLKNIGKFTVNHLCQNFFLIELQAWTLVQVFSCEFCEISRNTFFYRTPLVAASANLPNGGNFWFFYPFKPFSISNFAMAKWFCHVTCFAKVYLILFFSFEQTWYFYRKKVAT